MHVINIFKAEYILEEGQGCQIIQMGFVRRLADAVSVKVQRCKGEAAASMVTHTL